MLWEESEIFVRKTQLGRLDRWHTCRFDYKRTSNGTALNKFRLKWQKLLAMPGNVINMKSINKNKFR